MPLNKSLDSGVWRRLTPEEQVDALNKTLASTPKWRMLKRWRVRQVIEFYQIQSILRDNRQTPKEKK